MLYFHELFYVGSLLLLVFGFTEGKQIQIQIQIQDWSLLGAMDPIKKSVAVAFTSTQCLLYSFIDHGGSLAERFCLHCNML
jgi:hypothetical protein